MLLDNIELTVLLVILIIILAFYLFWLLWFSRKPKRKIPTEKNVIVSPANGTVAVVKSVKARTKAEKWNYAAAEILAADVAKECWLLLIVMTPFNVHYQRAPYEGTVQRTEHSPGRFLNAVKHPEQLKTLENEKNEILFSTKKGKIKIIQIAGLLARRISCYVRPEQKVKKGDVVGFINLGSQVAVILPRSVKVTVKPGTRVVDGETIIGEFS